MKMQFRVWYNGEMIVRQPWMSFHEFHITPDGNVFVRGESGYVNGKDHSAILMLGTGIEDKNGVEVFEGDKVKFFFDEANGWKTFVVERSNIGFHFGRMNVYTLGDLYRHPHTVEVVGHVYDNDGNKAEPSSGSDPGTVQRAA